MSSDRSAQESAQQNAQQSGIRSDIVICACLVLVTAGVFAQTAGFAFVGYDDPAYLLDNPTVSSGLTWDGTGWAFSTWHAANWHPLTWLSHMLDVEMWGRWAGGHHLGSVALHVLNTLLLFGLLRAQTANRWRSALVAALFALHPLHVESVAWVSERKDVLSTSFGLLSLWCYTAWTRRGGTYLYLVALSSFGLSLLAKPTWIVLPVLLLLLDFWPLERLRSGLDGLSRRRLAVEKVPYVVLSVGSALVTLAAQREGGALWSSAEVPLPLRLANAALSACRYLGKTLWPSDLVVLYPHPYLPETGGIAWSVWQIAAALAFLMVVSVAVWRAHSRPALLFGWLWYLAVLAPVIGIVQVGAQGIADRYSYVSLIGVFVAVVWGIGDTLRGQAARRAAAVLSVAVLFAFAVTSWNQVRVWRNSVSLFEHALERAPGNWIVHAHLGDALLEDPRPSRADVEKAAEHYAAVVGIRPTHLGARESLASLLAQLGRRAEADEMLSETERLRAARSAAQP